MKYTVYKITNTINGKIYIGCHRTENLDDGYMGSGNLICRAIAKYGAEFFVKEYIAIFDTSEEMFDMESKLVNEEFVSRSDTYNLKEGGLGGWDFARKYPGKREQDLKNLTLAAPALAKLRTDPEWTQQLFIKMSNIRKRYFEDNPGRFTGLSHTDKTKAAIGEASAIHQCGEGNSQYGSMWIHSLEEKRSKKINKNDPIPDGWIKGRKIKF
jgi:hypothetical protein